MSKKLKNLFLLVFSMLVLTNCAIVAIGAVGAAAVGTTAAVATDPRLSGTVINDNKIEAKLKITYSEYNNANIDATNMMTNPEALEKNPSMDDEKW